jgi:monofunctional biosynthetic peptidoglycan transglycosylase
MRWFGAVPLALVGALWAWWLFLPWPVHLRWLEPGRTAFMEQRLDAAPDDGERLELSHQYVPLDSVSRHLQRAVVVAEDGNFHEHAGIDWAALRQEFRWQGDDEFSWLDGDDRAALVAAVRYYRANRDEIRGRSTITQQLAKNLYFSGARSPLRKLEEAIVAMRLERFLSKDRILELYLNVAEWGPGIFGAEAAARHYFDRAAADLTRSQAAALAATLPHPLTSNPERNSGRMAWRRDIILARMGGTGPVQTVPLGPDVPAADELDAAVELAPVGTPLDSVPPVDTLPPPPDTVAPPDTTGPPDTTAVRPRAAH